MLKPEKPVYKFKQIEKLSPNTIKSYSVYNLLEGNQIDKSQNNKEN